MIGYSAGQDSTPFQLLEWYRQDENGIQKNAAVTYHDYAAGFYMVLRPEWKNRFVVIVDESVSHGTGYYLGEKYDNKDGNYIFALYLFNGTDRMQLSKSQGRFLLGEINDVCISAKIGSGKLAANLTEEELMDNFHLIYTDWTN